MVDGEMHYSGVRYGGIMRPGPWGTLRADCLPHDRIYSVSRGDLKRFVEKGVATSDLAA